MEFETIVFEKQDRVATITLNRPERLNAINGVMSRELPRAWADVMERPRRVRGHRHGRGGEELLHRLRHDGRDRRQDRRDDDKSRGGRREQPRHARFDPLHRHPERMLEARDHGGERHGHGGGLHFIADSDLIVAAEHATFFDNHVRVGMVSRDWSPWG